MPLAQTDTEKSLFSAYSAYNLPSVESLVHYLHAASGFPVKSTWIKAIEAGNFATSPGLTYSNVKKNYPDSSKTIKAHNVQYRQNVHSTKPPPINYPTMPMVAEEPLEGTLPMLP